MRIGLGVASVALVALSACGGGSGPGAGTAATATPSLGLLTANQACVQVEMVNDELGGPPGAWTIPTYGKFGDKMAALARESVPEVAGALKAMSDQALEVGEMSLDDDVTTAAGIWATHYQAVADICMRTASPIARLA